MSVATTILNRLTTAGSAQPCLTWYGDDDERVELSGRVLANWVTKATNLLVEDADVGPGSRVVLDLPTHWRTVVWALAAWAAGAEVVLPPEEEADDDDVEAWGEMEDEDEVADDEGFVPDADEDEPDVVVTARPAQAPTAGLVLVVALPALARHVEEAVPAGAVDAAAAIMSYGDVLGPVREPDPAAEALSGVAGLDAAPSVTFADLAEWAVHQLPAAHRDEAGARVLCAPGSVDQLLGHALATWLAGGSVVLLGEDVPHERFAHIAETERATVRC
ncbi:TIGR03089 family protein [Georgenia faecalis]|uniref:TIGR03089 family protein n=1 Tax=Georgenia faecalis TaxID=2483799 RepID=A0ABV9DDU7_9MICO|nr:TIGR03089 family protein [Georgenia faecalis]